jgi:outer membrane protein
MKTSSFILFLLFTVCSWTTIQAQKFGYVNTSELIEAHPQVAISNKVLEAYSDSLVVPFEEKAATFQKKYEFFVEEVNAGTLSKVSQDARANELQAEQQKLQAEDQQIQRSLELKRDALLRPILSEIDTLIQNKGKEGKYTMIFDTSVTGALLYAQESDDLTAEIKAIIVGKS